MISKKLMHFSGLLALSAAFLASCGAEATKTYTVTFDTNGGSTVADQQIEHGKKASKPADPVKSAYTFDGWYADSYCKVPFDFDTEITADWTIYAAWQAGGPIIPDSSSSSEQSSSQAQSSDTSSPWTMTFVDASWWNKDAASVNYTLNPEADGSGTLPANKATYDTVHGYVDGVNYWTVDIPADATKIQFFRAGDNGTADWGARTVVIDLTSRGESTKWTLTTTETWYGNGNLASGSWN